MAPCIPDDWKEFTVIRRFRGTEYNIHVKRTGNRSMQVDGVAVEGNIVPLVDRTAVSVEVTL